MKISYDEMAQKFTLPEFMPESGVMPLHYCWKYSVSVTATQLWPFIADTSLFNRFIGMAPRTEKEIKGERWVQTTVFGVKQEWIEDPWQWVHEQSVQFDRRYTRGIAKAVRTNIFLEPTDDGVQVYFIFTWLPRNSAMRAFLSVTDSVIHGKFAAALKQVESSFQKTSAVTPTRAFRHRNDPTKNVNLSELEKAQQRIMAFNVSAPALQGLIDFIKFADDVDLYRIRAIELAEQLGLKKREMVTACMQSVREGLLTISWDVVCPHCRGVRLEADTLGNIPPNSECFVCDVDFETDTLESIEVTFHVNPSYRKVAQVLFCSAEPAKKDHIQVQQTLAPKETLKIAIPLKEGRHRIRFKGDGAVLFFEVLADLESKIIPWNTEGTPEKIECGVNSSFLLENQTGTLKSFTLEQLWWKDNILHPADVFAIQEFRDIFSRDSLNSQVRMSLGVQTLMFTDIVNSTGFYSSRGDAAAFNDVRKHFLEVFEIVTAHEGTVIKTIGDSVMASFLSPENAVLASLKIQEKFSCNREDLTIRLRISLHLGQVIAVHLNQGLDLFGNTVNKAAKLQTCAGSGEIAMSSEVHLSCVDSVLRPFREFIGHRISSVQYKELPLQAEVLTYHDYIAAKQGKALSA